MKFKKNNVFCQTIANNSPGISWPGVKIMMVFSKIREMRVDTLIIKLDIKKSRTRIGFKIQMEKQ
jgi:3'-phosphoadenosine 5'-phosphosulfate sulfotransferase